MASLTGRRGGASPPAGVGPPTPESSDWLELSSGRSEPSEPRSSSSEAEEESLEAAAAAFGGGGGGSGPGGRWETWSLGNAVLQGMGLEMIRDFLFLDLDLELWGEEER